MIYLYVKQHSITGLKYFGKTNSKDPFSYTGSGKYWTNHINKHGKEHIKTLDIYGFDDQELCTEFALKFSQDNNIVESSDWANLIFEDGKTGGNIVQFLTDKRKADMYRKITLANSGENNPSKRLEVRQKISSSLTGKKSSLESIKKNSEYRKGKNKENYEPINRMSKTMSVIMSNRTKENSEMRRNHSKSLSKSMTGRNKENCSRVKAAAKTLSETLSTLKINHRKIIYELKESNMDFNDILTHMRSLITDKNININMIKNAYNKYITQDLL